MYGVPDWFSEVTLETLQKCWCKLLPNNDYLEQIEGEEGEELEEGLISLIRKLPGCKDSNENVEHDLLNQDEQCECLEDDIVDIVKDTGEGKEYGDDEHTGEEKMSDSDGTAALEVALHCVQQQPKYTSREILLLKKYSSGQKHKILFLFLTEKN